MLCSFSLCADWVRAWWISTMTNWTFPSLPGSTTEDWSIIQAFMIVDISHPVYTNIRRLFSPKQNNFWLCGQAFASFQHGLFISSDMNKPCWKLVKACPQSQKLFCFGENNLLISFRLFAYYLLTSTTKTMLFAICKCNCHTSHSWNPSLGS